MRALVVVGLLCGTASAEPPRWWVDAGPVMGVPRGDLVYERHSWGFAIEVGKQVAPHFSLFAGYRKLWVSTTREDNNEPYALHNMQWIAGLRYARRMTGPLAGFVDGEGHLERFKVDHVDFAFSDQPPINGLGGAVRAGLFVHLGASIVVGTAVGYSAALINIADMNLGPTFHSPFIDSWITADAFVGGAF